MSMTSPTKFYHVTQIIVDVFMWPKFGNFCIYMREVIITSTLRGFDQKKHFFEGWSWLKFNNLEQALGMALKLYTNQKVFVNNSYVCRSYRGKTGRMALSTLPTPILNRVKS